MKPIRVVRPVVSSVLLSYAQIFFSDRIIFGLVLFGVSLFNISAGISGLLSIVMANVAAWIMGINRAKIAAGTYGFNPLLVGLGMGIYFEFNWVLFLILIFTSLLTLMLTLLFEGWLAKYKLPFLSLPFLFALWIAALASHQFTGLNINAKGVFLYNDIVSNFGQQALTLHLQIQEMGIPLSLKTYFNSLAAIFFQYNIYAGVVIAFGLLLASRISFLLSLTGFYSAYLYYSIVGADFTELHYSYIGFNYILTAIAVGGFFLIPSVYSFLWVIFLTPIISFIMTSSNAVLATFGLSTFALPFNFAVIVFLYTFTFREIRRSGIELTLIQHNSPEKNLYHYQNYKTRFANNPLISIALPFFGSWKINQAHKGDYTHHGKWQHAWDFVLEEDGKEFSGNGSSVEDYYCYNKTIISPADGIVEQITDGIEDNKVGDVNLKQNWGNSITIRHDYKLFSQISHIKSGSFKVKQGDFVKKGQPLAVVGNSGRSPYPHLHFQLQANPYVGSETLQYPIANYIATQEKTDKLQVNSIPKLGQTIRNTEPEKALKTAFGFIPGQELILSNGKEELHWKVEIDYFNNTYIRCEKTGSKAFFTKNDNRLTFNSFHGSKKSVLFKFYLAAFHVVFSYHQSMQINDFLPSNTIRNLKTFLQDFVAPFYIYIKPRFRMDYLEKESYFDESRIKLQSTIKLNHKYDFTNDFSIDDKGIEKWTITSKRGAQTFIFTRDL